MVFLPECDFFFRFFYSLFQFFGIDGFQEIVERTEFDGLYSVVSVGGDENHFKIGCGEAFEQGEAVPSRHFYVEEYKVGLEAQDFVPGFGGRGAAGGYGYLRAMGVEVVPEVFAVVEFIVDDYCFHVFCVFEVLYRDRKDHPAAALWFGVLPVFQQNADVRAILFV